jgi:hypothetical protein
MIKLCAPRNNLRELGLVVGEHIYIGCYALAGYNFRSSASPWRGREGILRLFIRLSPRLAFWCGIDHKVRPYLRLMA